MDRNDAIISNMDSKQVVEHFSLRHKIAAATALLAMAIAVVSALATMFLTDWDWSLLDGLLWLVLVPLSLGWLLFTVVGSHILWRWTDRTLVTRRQRSIPHFSADLLAFTESQLPQAAIAARFLHKAIRELESAVLDLLADLQVHNRLRSPSLQRTDWTKLPVGRIARSAQVRAAYRHMVEEARQGVSSSDTSADPDVYAWVVAIVTMNAQLVELATHCENAYFAYRKVALSAVDAAAYEEAFVAARTSAAESASVYDAVRAEYG